jgi:MOSC domain-containing protein YiiM
MLATIAQVRTSPILPIDRAGKTIRSAILKQPRSGPVPLTTLGLQGDDQADKRHHGGIHQALYLYPIEHYLAFQAELRAQPIDNLTDLPLGTVGENLLTQGLSDTSIFPGDILTITNPTNTSPPVRLIITSPRMPCATLAHVTSPAFVKAFLNSGRVGFYARILSPGSITQGDHISLTPATNRPLSIRDLAHTRAGILHPSASTLRQTIAVDGLHPEWKSKLESILAKLHPSE